MLAIGGTWVVSLDEGQMNPIEKRWHLNQVLRKLYGFSSQAREHNAPGKVKNCKQEREGRFDEASVWEKQYILSEQEWGGTWMQNQEAVPSGMWLQSRMALVNWADDDLIK